MYFIDEFVQKVFVDVMQCWIVVTLAAMSSNDWSGPVTL